MKEEKFPHTRKPLHWWRLGGGVVSFGATEESAATGVQMAKQRDSSQRTSADQHSPDREDCLLTRWGRWGLGAEAGLQRSDPRERTGVGCMNTG